MAPRKSKKTSTKKPKGGNGKESDNISIQPYKRDLTVGLTREEVELKAQEMSHLLSTRDIAEQDFKEQAKSNNSSLKGMENNLRKLGNVIRDKAEQRPVDCERRTDYTKGIVTDVRLDTGEILDTRQLTDAERQEGLPFEPPPDVDDEFGDDSEPDADAPDDDDAEDDSE